MRDTEMFEITVRVNGLRQTIEVEAETARQASEFVRMHVQSLDGEGPKDPNAPKTNVQVVTEIMEFSDYGALVQAFVIEAISRYAQQVAESDPAQFSANSMVAPEAWIGVAKEVRSKMETKYGKRTR